MAKLGPLPDAPGVVKIRLLGKTAGNTNWANVMHAKVSGVLSFGTLSAASTTIRTAWTTNFAPLVCPTWSLTTVEVTDLTTRTGNQGTDNIVVPGSSSGVTGPASLAACLTLKIPNRYRGGHPRMYMGGVSTVKTTDGVTWAPGVASSYTAAGRAFLIAVNAITTGSTTWQLCAVSYYHKVGTAQAYKVPPDVYLISDIVCHNRVDSMRTRLGKETS